MYIYAANIFWKDIKKKKNSGSPQGGSGKSARTFLSWAPIRPNPTPFPRSSRGQSDHADPEFVSGNT